MNWNDERKFMHRFKVISLTVFLIIVVMLQGCKSKSRNSIDVLSASKVAQQLTLSDNYAYSSLTAEEKQAYNIIYDTILNFNKKADIKNIDEDKIKKAFFYVLKDHPEIFWCNAYEIQVTRLGFDLYSEIIPEYTLNKEETEAWAKEIEECVDLIIKDIPDDASDYLKVKAVYDHIITQTQYDEAEINNQNILSVFINHKSVCRGYAKAFQYVLSKLGIESIVVDGEVKNTPHAWNAVKMDGKWYWFDITWGDLLLSENGDSKIDYSYFGITTSELLTDHKINDTIPIPDCSSQSDNYFVKEGLFFSDIQEAREKISKLKDEGKTISFKLSSSKVFDEAYQYFIKEKHIFDCLPDKKVTVYTCVNVINLELSE